MPRSLALLSLILLAGCAGGGSSGVRYNDEYIAKVNPAGKTVVLVIDVSKSMDFNDRERFNEQGAQLALVLGSSQDNVGAVSFSTDAKVVSRLAQLEDKGARYAAQRRLSDMTRDGQTNYVAALEYGNRMLTKANAPRDAVVLFLTDGEHNVGGSSSDVLNELTSYIQHGWKVYCIGLGAEAQSSTLLKEIAVRTEGAYFPAMTPEDLMGAFVKILSQVFGLIAFDGGIKPLQVDPGMKRLIYLMVKGSKETTLGTLTSGGAPVDLFANAGIYRYPAQSNRMGQIEAMHVDKPAAAMTELAIDGPTKQTLMLWQPDFAIEIDDGFPAAEYFEGEKIEFSMRVTGSDTIMEKVRKSGTAKVIVTNEKGDKVAEVELEKDGKKDGPVKFQGRMVTPLEPGLVTANMKFTLTDEAGNTWQHEKRSTIRINGTARVASIEMIPATIDQGTRWASPEAVASDLTVSLKGKMGADVTLTTKSDKIKMSPDSFKLAPGDTKTVSVKVMGDQPGTFSETIALSGAQEGGTRVSAPPVTVKWKVLGLTGTPEIPQITTSQGKAFKVPVDIGVTGGGAVTIEVESPTGPGGKLEAKIVEEDGKKYLVGTIPGDAASGAYKGAIKVTAAGETVPPRTIPLNVNVGSAEPVVGLKTKEISINADKSGWSQWQSIAFDFEFVRGADVAIKFGDLKGTKGGTIDGKFRQGFRGAGGWDGKKLPQAGSYTGEYRVSISNDLAPDTYTGKVKIEVTDAGKVYTTEIPVTVVYKPE